MDRSFAAGSTAPRRRASKSASARSVSWRKIARDALSAPRTALRALSARRRLRTAVACAIVALPLLGGGWLWLRHSSLVAVEHVTITGAHGPQAGAIEAALRDQGHTRPTCKRLALLVAGLLDGERGTPSAVAHRAFTLRIGTAQQEASVARRRGM